MRTRRAVRAFRPPICALSIRIGSLFVALVLLASVTAAQRQVLYLGPNSKPMSAEDVIRLTKAGVGDEVIIEQLKAKNERFALSTDQIVQLKAAKVSDRVIATMINPAYKGTQPTVTPSKAVVTTSPAMPAAAAPANRSTVPAPAPTSSVAAMDVPDGIPTDLGVYVKIKGNWTPLSSEVVTWKPGGVAKSVASGGIVKGDLNGFIDGSTSQFHTLNPLELVIVVPEGISITDYQLVRLHDHEDYREFRTVTGGVFHVSGGATRDAVPFDSVQVAPRIYRATLSTALGEYGILPPGAFTSMSASSSGKIFSFGLVDSCGFTVPSCE